MSDFFSFLRSNRSKIGLVDSYDLGEIYAADERNALKNIFLDPDGLDQIYTLSREGLTKEDIRTMGGLDKSVINSFNISRWTLSGVGFDISRQIRTDDNIGEPGKYAGDSPGFSDNLIVFHGGIAANNIEYNFLDDNGEVRTTTVPTSRESLFNSLKDTEGRITLASYPSLFRIRRRSHVNELRLKQTMLIPRETVVESPTDTLMIPIYMRTLANTDPEVTPLRCYATKNSPIILPVRINSSATITIKRNPTLAVSRAPFVFGWELKRRHDKLLVRSDIGASQQGDTVSIPINVVGTLGQGVDCDLLIYLDPTQVEELNLSSLGLKEIAAQDIGLVGFSSLKRLILRNNELSTIPVWLKTLDSKLEYLDLTGNTYWNNGIVGVFDYQDLRGTSISGRSDLAPPTITATQVLGYSGYLANGTKRSTYTGEYETISDGTKLYKDLRKDSISGTTPITTSNAEGFRIFTALKELHVGPSVPFINADFSRIFPNLENFQASTGGTSPRRLLGLLPKFKNNSQSITLNYTEQDNLGGTINYMGDTLTWTDDIDTTYQSDNNDPVAKEFIGQFRVKELSAWNTRIRGGFFTGPDDVNNVAGRFHVDSQGNVTRAWDGWLRNLEVLTLGWYTRACLKVATGSSLDWRRLRYLMLNHSWSGDSSNVVFYNTGVSASSEVSDDVLIGNSWGELHAWESGWSGRIFSISRAPNLRILQLGNNEWNGYGSGAFKFMLPSNFTTSSSTFRLQGLYTHYFKNSQAKRFILRSDELKNLPNLLEWSLRASKVFGKFPTIYNDSAAASVVMNYIDARECNFRDLSSLGSSSTTRIKEIYFSSQGSDVGGALMPNFTASSNSNITTIEGDSCLSSYYPGNWYTSGVRSRVIEPLISSTTEENAVAGVTWYRDPNDSERLIANNAGNVALSAYVMVGDTILYESNAVGTVTQLDISNGYIFARGSGLTSIPTSGTNALTFRRAGQDISTYFEQHRNLSVIRLKNNRIAGTIPKFTGCRSVSQLDLSDNLLSEYQLGTIGTSCLLGTSGAVALRNIFLNNNPLTKESIRKIIRDCFDFVSSVRNRNYNIYINLRSTRWDSSSKSYRNWTRAEIFDGGTTITVPDPTEENPNRTRTEIIPDTYEQYFNRMGSGTTYPNMRIDLF